MDGSMDSTSPFATTASHRTGIPLNLVLVVGCVAALDMASMTLFFVVSYLQAIDSPSLPAKLWKITDGIFCVSILYLMLATGGYRQTMLGNPFSQISRILVNATAIAGLEWGGLVAFDQADIFDWPYSGPLNVISGGVLVMCLIRLLAHKVLVSSARTGSITHTVAVVGAGELGQRLIEALDNRCDPWTRVIGLFDDRLHRLQHRDGQDIPIQGTVDDLIAYSRANRIDDILVALPWGAEQRLLDILSTLKVIPANVRMAPDIIGHHFLDKGFSRLDGIPVYNIFRKPISGWGEFLKRAEDLLLGGLILILLSPLMLLCATAIKLDSKGPVLFRQNRYGYNNTLIGVYKFRSMYHEMRDDNCERQTVADDPRITRVGNILRKTSLDELPQLFNVIRGDMSLVGPRPHATNTKAAGKLFEEVVREYSVRHKVKPGITGWAQVMGWRGETDTEEKILRRVECDIYYMENWSIFLDIEIIFRTIFVVAGKNVY